MEGAVVSLVSVGQYGGLRRFFANPPVGIIGAVASVVSLILARVFYLQGQRYPELEYLAHPAPVVLAPPGGALQVQFNPSRGNHHCETSGRNPSHHFRRRTTT